MNLELVREEHVNGAIPGKLYKDGFFYCYTIETERNYIKPGLMQLVPQWWERKNRWVVKIDAPGHTAIYMHGGNTEKDSNGCVLCAEYRTGADSIWKDKSKQLWNDFEAAGKTGTIRVYDPGEKDKEGVTNIVLIALIAGGALFALRKFL